MLKKVMIICLAFSFVFIGGIAFASDEEQGVLEEGQTIIPESAQSPADVISAELKDEADELKDEAKDEADELKDEAKDAGDELKDELKE